MRSVLVFATDAKGHPLAAPPAPADLRILENGQPVEILAVEKMPSAGRAAAPSEPSPAAATAPASAETAADPGTPSTSISTRRRSTSAR